MTERDRLIELLIKAKVTWNPCGIADYLLKNGIIVPPCNMGDTVYIITTKHPCYACHFCTDFCHKDCRIDDKAKQVVKKAQVCSIELGAINKICAEIEETKIAYSYKYTCWFEDFGKTVFLTREEAEKVLKDKYDKCMIKQYVEDCEYCGFCGKENKYI